MSTDAELLGQLERDGRLIASTAVTAGWDTPVPGLAWDVRTVVTHLGAVHRWCADLVDRRLETNETGGSSAFWPDPIDDDDLPQWFADGLGALVATLRAAPGDLTGYTMLDDVPARDFWLRRQAHETAIHRADVQAAAGLSPSEIADSLPADFAQTGLTELIGGFAREPAFAAETAGTLLFRADDGPGWLVTFAPDGNTARSAADHADLGAVEAVVSGSSAQLYLWAWNRPAEVSANGSADVLGHWRRVIIG